MKVMDHNSKGSRNQIVLLNAFNEPSWVEN